MYLLKNARSQFHVKCKYREFNFAMAYDTWNVSYLYFLWTYEQSKLSRLKITGIKYRRGDSRRSGTMLSSHLQHLYWSCKTDSNCGQQRTGTGTLSWGFGLCNCGQSGIMSARDSLRVATELRLLSVCCASNSSMSNLRRCNS